MEIPRLISSPKQEPTWQCSTPPGRKPILRKQMACKLCPYQSTLYSTFPGGGRQKSVSTYWLAGQRRRLHGGMNIWRQSFQHPQNQVKKPEIVEGRARSLFSILSATSREEMSLFRVGVWFILVQAVLFTLVRSLSSLSNTPCLLSYVSLSTIIKFQMRHTYHSKVSLFLK